MGWTNIFKVGKHTASNGNELTYSEADLQKTVASYDPSHHEAPLVFGHPAQDGPAYGWVKQLRGKGEYLQAQFAQVPDEVKQMVEDGRYKKVSVRLNDDLSLRHVGLLGATPPAVKGLGNIQFSESDESSIYDFSETNNGGSPSMTPEELKAALAAEKAKTKQLEDEKKSAEEKAREAEEAKTKAEEAKGKIEGKLAEGEAAARKEKLETKVETLVEAGNILPAEKEQVMAFAEGLHGGEELCFSEGEGKKSLEDHFFKFLEGRAKHELFSEFSEPESQKETANNSDLVNYC
ncbi:MAG: hypothetical protein ACNI27_07115 [Desulfovibrio sp.]